MTDELRAFLHQLMLDQCNGKLTVLEMLEEAYQHGHYAGCGYFAADNDL